MIIVYLSQVVKVYANDWHLGKSGWGFQNSALHLEGTNLRFYSYQDLNAWSSGLSASKSPSVTTVTQGSGFPDLGLVGPESSYSGLGIPRLGAGKYWILSIRGEEQGPLSS